MLSGGERRRLALAVVVASGANFLVLDEPTNHLDLEIREALEAALENFPATVLLVSHDRALLDAVAERTLAIEDGTIRSYDGGWADYVRARDPRARHARDRPGPVQTPQSTKPSGSPASHGRTAGASVALERVERDRRVRKRRSPSSSASSPTTWGDAELWLRTERPRNELQALLERWETLFEEAQA